MDTSYRFSHAFIDTARGNFPAVLAALGNRLNGVPIQDAVDASACALRANALERLGHVDSATQELRTGFARGPVLRSTIEKFIEVPQLWFVYPKPATSASGACANRR